MAATLGNYSPIFYAQEAVSLLENALGFTRRIHRGYDEERRSFNQGEYVYIKKPGTFTTQAGGTDNVMDITTESIALQLTNWREVRFGLTDKELAFSSERIIEDHIRPAVYALADYVDTTVLADTTMKIPLFNTIAAASSTYAQDIADTRGVQRAAKVPLEEVDKMHFMVDGAMEAKLLGSSAFSQHQGAGDTGVSTQVTGTLGRKFGYEFFANQNTETLPNGDAADLVGALDGGVAAGATTVIIDGLTDTQTFKKGCTFVVTGFTDVTYTLTQDVTVGTPDAGQITATMWPPAPEALDDGAVVTLAHAGTASQSPVNNIAFHRDMTALAFAKMPDQLLRKLGAQVYSVQDEKSGIAVRARLYADHKISAVRVCLDVLFGYRMLTPTLGCRAIQLTA